MLHRRQAAFRPWDVHVARVNTHVLHCRRERQLCVRKVPPDASSPSATFRHAAARSEICRRRGRLAPCPPVTPAVSWPTIRLPEPDIIARRSIAATVRPASDNADVRANTHEEGGASPPPVGTPHPPSVRRCWRTKFEGLQTQTEKHRETEIESCNSLLTLLFFC